jgi:hypothetical protein
MRVLSRFCIILCLFLPVVSTFADGMDPVSYIGMDLPTAVATLGLPQQMYTFRGSDDTRDTVVFYYPARLYLFWFKDRVWQVRFDKRYPASVLGATMGMTQDLVHAFAPRDYQQSVDSLYFDITGLAFPVRVRLVFAAGVLSDIYIYRSDF